MKNKRGLSLLQSTIVFLLLNAVFFGTLFIVVDRESTTAPIFEEAYAKQTALLIDRAKAGTTNEIDISELMVVAKQKSRAPEVNLDCNSNTINVKVTNGKGYTQKYFTNL